MDTIVVGVPDHECGDVHQHDRVGVPVADVATGAQLGLLLGGEALSAVGADKQPCGALALGGPVGVVGQRGDAVQLGVDPEPVPTIPTTASTSTANRVSTMRRRRRLGFRDRRTWWGRSGLAHSRIRPPRRWRRILRR